MQLRADENPKIYVAGHRGLLGSAVVRNLERRGFHNLLKRTHAEVDLENQAQTFSFLAAERPDFVFMCAARVGGITANLRARGEFLYRNLAMQNNVIEGARRAGVRKLLFVASSCCYPREAQCPIKEEALFTGPFEPTNEGYAIAKAAGVKMCEHYREQYGCDFIAAMPTNLYGINDNYDPEESHLLAALIRKAHHAKTTGSNEMELWGSGTPRREFLSSDDGADALVFLMEHYSGAIAINVGTGVDDSIAGLATVVARVITGRELTLRLDPSRPDGVMRKVLDVSRLSALGWTASTKLEDGIRIAYADYLSRLPT